jgi:glycosyltransferase involved in cell wall biosynthesis
MLISTVSEFQARKIRNQGGMNCHVIPNGVDVSSYPFSARGNGALLFIGRMEWVKGPDLAIQIARSLGLELVMAGPIVEHEFFDRAVKPFLGDRVRYVGVVDHQRKSELFGRAACVLLPFRGEEPFGLVTVEAMACGAPVVALANGALPEIVENGLTGYIGDDENALPELVQEAMRLDRRTIREQVTKRFSISTIAMMYQNLYTHMLATSRP